MKEIVQDGAEVLSEVAKPVPEELFGSDELKRIIADMEATLDIESEGVALAAPQIGISYRIFIVRVDRAVPGPQLGELGGPTPKLDLWVGPPSVAPQVDVYINPEIIKTSRRKTEVEEGCLSLRNVYGKTVRHERVTVRARRSDGTRFERGAGGIMAQVFEHEIDHLNGTLFTEHANSLVRITQNEHGYKHKPL